MTARSWLVIAVTAVLVVVYVAVRKPSLGLQPKLTAAWVGIEIENDPVARVGRVELASGQRFVLRAVVEAEDRRGRKVYYTEAGRLEMFGQEVPADSLEVWDGGRTRVLWFTVEGSPPFAEFQADSDPSAPTFREVFQAEWPFAWSVPGRVQPVVENYLPRDPSARRGERFGTQRFHVRVEVLGPESEILPRQRLKSWDGSDVFEQKERFPTVVAKLPGSLERLSRVFGLSQREPVGADRAAALEATFAWLNADLAFSRVGLLRSWLDSNSIDWENLEWQPVEIAADFDWGQPGDPLRAGERLVWLLEDRGQVGILDYDDLCLDFDRGATVSTLREVFSGTGIVERARVERD